MSSSDINGSDFRNFQVCGQLIGPFQGSSDEAPPERLVAGENVLWPNGSKLTVNISGDKASNFVKSKIQQFANVWSQFANITFSFTDSSDADIRVAVNTSGGSWSYVGTYCKQIPKNQPTMNFGWLTDATDDEEFSRVIVHEFGHALGCYHEQASPLAHIPWNKPVVYAYYLRTNGWDQAQVDAQVFAVLPQAGLVETSFDRTSIMEYSYPKEFTTDGSSAPWNTHLDDTDKTFIMKCYPKTGPTRTTSDGVYLVNCFKDNQVSSGVAYYKNMGGNDGKQPDAYVDVTHGSFTTWEGTAGSVKFNTGTVVKWNIEGDGNTQPQFSRVGSAGNGFENWNVYKDKYRVLYEIDGWKCYCVYWCF